MPAGEPSEASVQFPPRAGEPSEASVQFPPRAGEPSEASVQFPPRAGELSACPARFPLPAGGTLRRGFSIFRVRLGWLNDWRGWAIALSVASFAPALAPDSSLPVQAALTLLAGAGLLRLMHALDSRAVGQGVVAGLGLIALVLDSLSGGAWARLGALGHGTEAHGVGVQYGALALLWGLLVVRAWQRIEGNPLGAVVGLGALACWLGWAGLTPAVGWGAAATALALGLALLRRERDERKRVRLMLQNRVVRVVRRASNADLALTGIALVGLCLLALGLSGAPIPEIPRLGAHAGWQAGLILVCLAQVFLTTPSAGIDDPLLKVPPASRGNRMGAWLGFLARRGNCMGAWLGFLARGGNQMHAFHGSPREAGGTFRRGVQANSAQTIGLAILTLLGGEPLAVAALAALILWANDPAGLQEHPRHASNLPIRTGGTT
jgi:hypothetical protein